MITLTNTSEIVNKLRVYSKCYLSSCKRFVESEDDYKFELSLISKIGGYFQFVLFLASNGELSEILANDYSKEIKFESIEIVNNSFNIDFVHFSNLLNFKHNQDIKEALLEYYLFFTKNCYYGFASIIERKLTSEELAEFKAFVKVNSL